MLHAVRPHTLVNNVVFDVFAAEARQVQLIVHPFESTRLNFVFITAFLAAFPQANEGAAVRITVRLDLVAELSAHRQLPRRAIVEQNVRLALHRDVVVASDSHRMPHPHKR